MYPWLSVGHGPRLPWLQTWYECPVYVRVHYGRVHMSVRLLAKDLYTAITRPLEKKTDRLTCSRLLLTDSNKLVFTVRLHDTHTHTSVNTRALYTHMPA